MKRRPWTLEEKRTLAENSHLKGEELQQLADRMGRSINSIYDMRRKVKFREIKCDDPKDKNKMIWEMHRYDRYANDYLEHIMKEFYS